MEGVGTSPGPSFREETETDFAPRINSGGKVCVTPAMKIPYALRSKFTAPCKKRLSAEQAELEAGQVIQIPLGAGGYAGQATVTIYSAEATEFEADWNGSDPTRFPARLKAAATALQVCGCTGAFVISHADGVLTVQNSSPSRL